MAGKPFPQPQPGKPVTQKTHPHQAKTPCSLRLVPCSSSLQSMLPPIPFTFVRHGQTDWNVEGRLQGHTDTPLNATGLAQAHAAAKLLGQNQRSNNYTRIICSPLNRARTTATIIATELNLPLHVEGALVERSYGAYETRLKDELRRELNMPENTPFSSITPPQGESWEQVQNRGAKALLHWFIRYPSENLMFVGHGDFLSALNTALGTTPFKPQNATPYHYQPTPHGNWSITTL